MFNVLRKCSDDAMVAIAYSKGGVMYPNSGVEKISFDGAMVMIACSSGDSSWSFVIGNFSGLKPSSLFRVRLLCFGAPN